MNPLKWLEGYRTYALGLATILGGIVLLIDGKSFEGYTAIVTGLGLITGREAVRRIENKQ